MDGVNFKTLQPNDFEIFEIIANWYFIEWKIPPDKTIQRLQTITVDTSQFQILLTLDGIPISTGGLYNHVGLHDKEPRYLIYKKWLALVYTTPNRRNMGYGALLCKHIEELSKKRGINKLYLFTDTAELLYQRLGWFETERVSMDSRNVIIMQKDLKIDKK